MRQLDRYVWGNIAGGYGVVMLALLTMFAVLALLGELDEIGEGDYGLGDALAYIGMTSPGVAVDLVPVIALVGTLIGLGRLAAAGELLVIQGAVPKRRLLWAAGKPGVVAVIAAMALAELGVPPLEQMARSHRQVAIEGARSATSGPGLWVRDQDRFVNIREMRHGRIPARIDVYEFDRAGRLQVFVHARRADPLPDGQWLLTSVTRKRISPSGVETEVLDQMRWDSLPGADKLAAFFQKPDRMAPSDLYLYVRDLRERGQDAVRYAVALWQKLTLPFATAGLVLLAVYFILGPLRNASTGGRIAVGAGVGIAFQALSQITAHLGLLWGVSPPVTALAPAGLVLVLSGLLLRRRV